jgi:ribonuclease R
MNFSIATLLSHFVDDKLVAAKILEKKLGCDDEESTEKLLIALDALEKIGILGTERGKYRRLHDDDVVEAKLRCSSKGFCFAIQDREGADDIYVRESHLSNAWNGDRVLVRIIKEGTRRRSPEGEVKLILERSNPSLLATVSQSEDGSYRAVPLDDRLLFELELQENGKSLSEAVERLVHVSVTRYPIAQNRPIGTVSRILGSDAEEAADTDIVSCKHDLAYNFPEKVVAATESLSPKIPAAEVKKRRDLRDFLTVTIEAEQSLEAIPLIENAFSLTQTEAGNWLLGVHIADVVHYIDRESPLAMEAKRRGTSIDLHDRIFPIFPEQINSIVSLLTGKDSLVISVLITIDKQGQIIEYEIQPSIIRVDQQLSYQQVQNLLRNSEEMESDLAPTMEMLTSLIFTISATFKAQRIQRGGFDITLPETRPLFKDEGRVGAIVSDYAFPLNSQLNEVVIVAGKLVAEHLNALAIPTIYCVHPEPDPEELEDLIKLGNNLGLELELSDPETITPQDYSRFTRKFDKVSATKVLNYLLLSTLKSVKYTTKSGKHFGLAYEGTYTHCCSPGRRYTDYLIQRILKTVLKQGRDRRTKSAKNPVNLASNTCHGKITWNVLPTEIEESLEFELATTVPRLNDREKVREDAEKDLDGLKKAEKMKERTGKVFEGLITGVQSYGFFVEIEDLLVEGLVHVSSLKDDWYEYRSRHSCLVGRKNRIKYQLGDRVEVEVKSVDYYRQQIDLVTVGGGSAASNEDLEEE